MGVRKTVARKGNLHTQNSLMCAPSSLHRSAAQERTEKGQGTRTETKGTKVTLSFEKEHKERGQRSQYVLLEPSHPLLDVSQELSVTVGAGEESLESSSEPFVIQMVLKCDGHPLITKKSSEFSSLPVTLTVTEEELRLIPSLRDEGSSYIKSCFLSVYLLFRTRNELQLPLSHVVDRKTRKKTKGGEAAPQQISEPLNCTRLLILKEDAMMCAYQGGGDNTGKFTSLELEELGMGKVVFGELVQYILLHHTHSRQYEYNCYHQVIATTNKKSSISLAVGDIVMSQRADHGKRDGPGESQAHVTKVKAKSRKHRGLVAVEVVSSNNKARTGHYDLSLTTPCITLSALLERVDFLEGMDEETEHTFARAVTKIVRKWLKQNWLKERSVPGARLKPTTVHHGDDVILNLAAAQIVYQWLARMRSFFVEFPRLLGAGVPLLLFKAEAEKLVLMCEHACCMLLRFCCTSGAVCATIKVNKRLYHRRYTRSVYGLWGPSLKESLQRLLVTEKIQLLCFLDSKGGTYLLEDLIPLVESKAFIESAFACEDSVSDVKTALQNPWRDTEDRLRFNDYFSTSCERLHLLCRPFGFRVTPLITVEAVDESTPQEPHLMITAPAEAVQRDESDSSDDVVASKSRNSGFVGLAEVLGRMDGKSREQDDSNASGNFAPPLGGLTSNEGGYQRLRSISGAYNISFILEPTQATSAGSDAWDVEQVQAWAEELEAKEERCSGLTAALLKEDVDGPRLKELSGSDLIRMGMPLGHALFVVSIIDELS